MIWLYMIIAAEGLLMMELCNMILEEDEDDNVFKAGEQDEQNE